MENNKTPLNFIHSNITERIEPSGNWRSVIMDVNSGFSFDVREKTEEKAVQLAHNIVTACNEYESNNQIIETLRNDAKNFFCELTEALAKNKQLIEALKEINEIDKKIPVGIHADYYSDALAHCGTIAQRALDQANEEKA